MSRLLLTAVLLIARAAIRRMRRASPTAALGTGDRSTSRAEPPIAAPASTSGGIRHGRRARRWQRLPLAVPATIAVLAVASVPTSWAVLSDAGTMRGVSVTAGTVEAPTDLQAQNTGSAVRLSWNAAVTGIPAQAYQVDRRPSGGAYPGTPAATVGSSPWDDGTPAECSSWAYRVRATHGNMASAPSSEVALTVDRTAPAVTAARLVFTGGPVNVADYVRTSGGSAEVYADVSDNCGGSPTVSFDLTNLGAGIVTGTPGSWTPVSGGATYNYRATVSVAAGAVTDGATRNWSVSALDANDNASGPFAGTPVTGDGAGPVFARAVMVSAYTNFYDAALGMGEVPSDGTARASGSYVYADFGDAGSSVATVTADLATSGLRAGPAVGLAEGSHTTYGSSSPWPWRSAAVTLATGLPDGTLTYTLTATDKVGNAATSGAQPVEVDDTTFASTSTTCTNLGDGDGLLGANDSTELAFGDTVFPGSIKAGWTGGTLTATAVLRQSTADFFNVNTDFGVTLMRGTTYTQALNLNATTWVTANTNFPNSTLALTSPSVLRLTYQGASVTNRMSTAIPSIGTGPRDAAGNRAGTFYTVTCSTGAW